MLVKKTDKRVALIKGARRLILQKGYAQTSLLDIAIESGVPLGNIYYYFKIKQEIGEAVIEEIGLEYQVFLRELEENPDPKIRLSLFIQSSLENIELLTRYGCELGSLAQALSKKSGNLANRTAKILDDLLSWCKTQFDALGFKKEAAYSLALHLISDLQGAYLLGQIFKDPTVIKKQVKRLQAWLEHLILESRLLEKALA